MLSGADVSDYCKKLNRNDIAVIIRTNHGMTKMIAFCSSFRSSFTRSISLARSIEICSIAYKHTL